MRLNAHDSIRIIEVDYTISIVLSEPSQNFAFKQSVCIMKSHFPISFLYT